MDQELNKLFDEYDLLETDDEKKYHDNARIVSEQFERKLSASGRKVRFAQDLIALFRYFLDARIPWQKKTLVVAALLYFILPLDAFPDLTPILGYLDDFGVVMAVTSFMARELAAYYPDGEPEPTPVPATEE